MFKETKNFAKQKVKWVDMPNFMAMQLNSYRWFLKDGLKELFEEMSPVSDYTGKELDLYFHDYYFDEPKFDELKAKQNSLSYEAPLRVRLELVNKRTKKSKEQEIYLGDFPLMTDRGTFIVNGVERVVISQLIRSPGVFFTALLYRNRKLFGAKVIPNRGAWLEFETDPDGVISVKIDRKRKTPVTALLRVFSVRKSQISRPTSPRDEVFGGRANLKSQSDGNKDILKLFKDVDTGDIKHIEATLKKDPSKNAAESFVEIYKHLRPGDPATADNARQLVEGIFFRNDRYDLAKVGRFKMNQRLNKPSSAKATEGKEEMLLSFNDLVDIVSEIIRLNNTEYAVPDDIDHLGNRRVRSLGELLQTKIRVGLARMDRIIRDRMSTYDINMLTPAQLINARPLIAAVKEFFTFSQLAQFMDQVNPLAELEHKRRISAMGPGGLTRERAGFEVRDVHTSHYGRICPIETPEGPNIGLVIHLASYAQVNELGFIETPYVKVKSYSAKGGSASGGKITGEIEWLNAFDEEKYVIAHGGTKYDKDNKIIEPIVEARVSGKPRMVKRGEVQYVDVSPQQIFSVATSLIPFLEHDDATRALMGSNMQRQAVSCVKPQAPLVGTGIEERAAVDSGQVITALEDGIATVVDAEHIVVQSQMSNVKGQKLGARTYQLNNFLRSNQYTSMSQQPLVEKGDKVKRGQALADGAATQNGNLALGQNLLVAFLSWGGANFEDAIIISERLVKDDRFTSIHIEDYSIDVRDTKLGPEITTPDIPNVSEEKLKNLDEEGIIRIGAEVVSGDILVGKISPKGEADLTSEERLLQAIFGEKARDVKDTSLLLSHGKRGRVIGIKIFSRDKGDKLEPGVLKRIQVEVAQLRKVQVGDKLAGRHGNKGVISKILAEEDMPYLADGRPVDIILNPLGVASRMNIGQILETHLGWAASKIGYRAITPSLDGATEEDIKIELKKAGLPESGKVILYDGQTGEPFNNRVTVGIIYIMKLNHLVEDKIHMRSVGPYSLITQQPLGGKAQFGGQRFGEMEVWALEGYGAAHTLQEMITIKSDDVTGRAMAFDAIIRGEEIKKPNIPASFNVLVNELKSLGLNVELVEKPLSAVASAEAGSERIKKEIKKVRIRT